MVACVDVVILTVVWYGVASCHVVICGVVWQNVLSIEYRNVLWSYFVFVVQVVLVVAVVSAVIVPLYVVH